MNDGEISSQFLSLFSFLKSEVIELQPEPPEDWRQKHGQLINLFHYYIAVTYINKSRDSSVGIALGYRLDDRDSRVRFLAGAGHFSLHHRVQNSSGAHPASYPMGTSGSFPGGKAAAA
jgi:hypothetical protein